MHREDLPIILAVAALAFGVLVPLLIAVVLGWVWLWENGYLVHWLVGTLAATLLAFAGRAWLGARLGAGQQAGGITGAQPGAMAPREADAWEAVEAIAAEVSGARLTDREAAWALATETVEAVAQKMHPGIERPIWRFTVPELLLLIEQVSARLRPLIRDAVPLGDRLTVEQMLAIYRWRGLATTAERAYDLWRIVRLVNPIAASTQELRERLSKAVMEDLREELAKRIARLYVREVGRAAIDLYSGRLKFSPAERDAHVTGETVADRATMAQPVEPLRFLVAGQTGAGKSSLINALAEDVHAAVDVLPATRDFTPYEVQREGMPQLFVIDSPGVSSEKDIDRLAGKATESDLILWVVSANRADRDQDHAALDAIRRRFRGLPERVPPKIIPVVTHIDRLRPFAEWDPPYDVTAGEVGKARSIRDAMTAIADDLGFDVSDLVPVMVSAGAPAYNVDLVWARLAGALTAAQSAQLLRSIGDAEGGLRLKQVLRQAVKGGRLAAGLFRG